MTPDEAIKKIKCTLWTLNKLNEIGEIDKEGTLFLISSTGPTTHNNTNYMLPYFTYTKGITNLGYTQG